MPTPSFTIHQLGNHDLALMDGVLTMFGEAQKLTELSKGSKTKAH